MNITKETEKYLEQHVFVKYCLKKGLINYSALAREIIDELKLKDANHDAVLVAARRYVEKLKFPSPNEKKIAELFKTAKLEIRNKIGVTILDKRISLDKLTELVKEVSKQAEILHIIHGTAAITIITSQEFNKQIAKTFAHYLVKQHTGLVEIIIKTSPDVEEIIGWEASLSSRLAENGINVYECIGAWSDNIYIIKEKDLPKAMQVLKF